MREMLVAFAAVIALIPQSAPAQDAGTRDDVRVVRGDAKILIADRARRAGIDPSTVVVDSVVAQNGHAIARWHAGTLWGVDPFARIYKRWWDRTGVETPTSIVAATDEATFENIDLLSARTDGFGIRITFAHNDASADARLTTIRGRRPTEAESWLAFPGGNSYFFFSGSVRSQTPIHVQAGSQLDVWFPFVLDPSYRYSLTIAYADPIVGPVDATLGDNVLHFVLPAFAMKPGVELMGEIEGDPRH